MIPSTKSLLRCIIEAPEAPHGVGIPQYAGTPLSSHFQYADSSDSSPSIFIYIFIIIGYSNRLLYCWNHDDNMILLCYIILYYNRYILEYYCTVS